MSSCAQDGQLHGDAQTLASLAEAGIRTVQDVLARSRDVRDLAERSNHVLELDGTTWFVKRRKRPPRRRALPREAREILRLRDLGVPTAPLAFFGVDPEAGGLTGTRSLAPAEPLDDLLRAGRVGAAAIPAVLRSLATLTADLHGGGLHHKDLYLNHLFLDAADPAGPLWLIDVERVDRHRRALGRWVVKDLAALRYSIPAGTVSERIQVRFLLRYLKARGLPRRGVLPGLMRRVRTKARRMASHTPRTPVGESGAPITGSP